MLNRKDLEYVATNVYDLVKDSQEPISYSQIIKLYNMPIPDPLAM